MKIVTDTCSLINFCNADALSIVCKLQGHRFFVSSGVLGECRPQTAAEVIRLKAAGKLDFIDDDDIPAAQVLDLLATQRLGVGEIEAIAACESLSLSLCSDDGPARKLATRILGKQRVVGSIRVLRWCVEESIISCDAAFGIFETMVACGGFLPPTEHSFFCPGIAAC